MKLHSLTLLTLVISASALADAGGIGGMESGTPVAGSSADWFCQDPHTAICSSVRTDAHTRRQRIAAVRYEARKKAESVMVLMLKQFLDIDLGDAATVKKIWSLPAPFKWVVLSIYHDALEQVIAEKVGPADTTTYLRDMTRLRNALIRALNEQLDGNYTARLVRAQMVEELKKVQLVTHLQRDLMEKLGSPGYQRVAKDYLEVCGEDGLANNGFATEGAGLRFIVLCPGWILSAVGAGQSDENNFRNLFHLIVHELAHHIDFSSQPLAYGKWNACMVQNHGTRLKKPKGEDVSVFLRPYLDQELTLSWYYRVNEHAREMTADYWGVQVTANYLRKSDLTRDEKVEFLRETWSGLCEGDDDGLHPSGRFRIETLLRRDPGITEVMGCQPSLAEVSRPGCTLEGADARGQY